MTLRQATFRISALAVLLAGAVWFRNSRQPLHHPPGILIKSDPEQSEIANAPPSVAARGWTLKPLAEFTVEARLLGKKRYRGNFVAELSPWDLALGWGKMSDESVLERLDITQDNRFYHWRYWGTPPIPEKEIITHSANIHIIPANDEVAGFIAALTVGTLIRLEGSLVEATHPRGDRPWRSSLARDDEGEGACEILYLRSAAKVSPGR